MASYDDPAISGASMILRPGVQALVQDAQRGKFRRGAGGSARPHEPRPSRRVNPSSIDQRDHRHIRRLRARYERPCGRNSYAFNEIASSHCLPQGRDYDEWDAITAGICERRNGVRGSVCAAAILSRSCPLWVKSGHRGRSGQCLLYPQKRTLIEASRRLPRAKSRRERALFPWAQLM